MELKTFKIVSRIIFPKCHPIWFLFYMYFKYCSVLKRHKKYDIGVLSDSVLWNIIRDNPRSNQDINNCVVVHPDNVFPRDRLLLLHHEEEKITRKVIIVAEEQCAKNKLYISNTFFYNCFASSSDFDWRLIKRSNTEINFADQIDLSLISNPFDISTLIIDDVVQSYFLLPKLIKKNDVVSINRRFFDEKSIYIQTRVNFVEYLQFKCTRVIFRNSEIDTDCFCLLGETTIRQSAHVKSFLPKVIFTGTRAVQKGEKKLSEVMLCPYGLEDLMDELERTLEPFLRKQNHSLRPAFLLQGNEGCGDEWLMSTLASYSGMHHYKVYNSDLTGNVYSHNESKMHNVFYAAKMAAPCIVSIHKFEHFGKNADGHYDSRLIESFANAFDYLFSNNDHPIILFCCSNSRQTPAELKAVFLEIFDINTPTQDQREAILKWVLEKSDIEPEGVDLQILASKTNGFQFNDLQALVYHAETGVCDGLDFDKALDFMQSNYNESLGAPKVPKVQWSDVGGLNDVKDEIIKTIDFPLKYPHLLEKTGLTRSGILLFGPPGTGKTLTAKAVATECNLCFLAVKGPELLNMYIGQSEQNIREVFDRARQAAPCIIFFDELDSLAPNRGHSGDSGGVMDRVVSQLLAEMDELDANGKIFVIGATNRPDLIDPALLRPGRYDKLLYVGPCTDTNSMISVLKALTKKFRLSDDVNLAEIVSMCPKNITGADFYGICSAAWSAAAKRLIKHIETESLDADTFIQEDVVVLQEDFLSALRNVKPSISDADLLYFEKIKKELI